MRTEGFLNQKQRHPVAMTLAVSINLAAVTALMLAKMGVPVAPPGVIDLINPTPDPPKPDETKPDPPIKVPTARSTPHIPEPQVPSDVPDSGASIAGTGDAVPGGWQGDAGTQAEPRPEPTPTPMPLITEPVPLPSAARDFQPPYPSQLLRMGVEGKAVVRVLIGADGRVTQVAIIAADDPLFAEATERQALRKWRFRPATRDGQAIESWKQMTVRFEIRS